MTEDKENSMKTGIELLAEERARQVEAEGWNAAHDDRYEHSELVRAAIGYIEAATLDDDARSRMAERGMVPRKWPWDPSWFKPTTRVRDLVKAGALIAAELDRLQRQKSQTA